MNGPAHEQTGPLSWATLRYIHHRGLVPYPEQGDDDPCPVPVDDDERTRP